MKIPITALLLLAAGHLATQAQTAELKEKVYYEASANTKVKHFDPATNTVGSVKTVLHNVSFRIISTQPFIDTDGTAYYLIRFLWFKKEKNETVLSPVDFKATRQLKDDDQYINSIDNDRVFIISVDDFSKGVNSGSIEEIAETGWSSFDFIAGANIQTPFKYRPKVNGNNYIFSPEINLGGFVGVKMRISKRDETYLILPVNFGLAGIPLGENTTDANAKNSLGMAFTYSSGIIIQFNGFQIGALVGEDLMGGALGDKWIYNGIPWYSAAIGYSFINTVSAKDRKQAATQRQIKNQADQIRLNDLSIRTNATQVVAPATVLPDSTHATH